MKESLLWHCPYLEGIDDGLREASRQRPREEALPQQHVAVGIAADDPLQEVIRAELERGLWRDLDDVHAVAAPQSGEPALAVQIQQRAADRQRLSPAVNLKC